MLNYNKFYATLARYKQQSHRLLKVDKNHDPWNSIDKSHNSRHIYHEAMGFIFIVFPFFFHFFLTLCSIVLSIKKTRLLFRLIEKIVSFVPSR